MRTNSAAKTVASTKLCVYLSSTDRKNHSLLLFQPLMLGNIESKQKKRGPIKSLAFFCLYVSGLC